MAFYDINGNDLTKQPTIDEQARALANACAERNYDPAKDPNGNYYGVVLSSIKQEIVENNKFINDALKGA